MDTIILNAVLQAIMVGCLVLFLNKFLEPRSQNRFYLPICFLIYWLLGTASRNLPQQFIAWSYLVIVFSLSLLVYREKTETKLFTAALMVTYMIAIEFMIYVTVAVGAKVANERLGGYFNWIVEIVAAIVLVGTIIGGMSKKRAVRIKNASPIYRWGYVGLFWLWSLPFIFIFNTYFEEIEFGEIRLIYALVAFEFSAVILIVLFELFLKYDEERQIRNSFDMQLFLIKEQQNSWNTFRHDINNMLTTLQGLAEQGETAGILSAVATIKGELHPMANKVYTRVPAIDAIINAKQQMTGEKGIVMQTQNNVMNEILINPMYVSIVLSNVLDNAIEACEQTEGESRITLIIEIAGQYLHIYVENTSPKRTPQKNGKFTSTKADQNLHGYGMVSIQKIVEKYDGEMICKYKEGVFSTAVMLRNNEDVRL